MEKGLTTPLGMQGENLASQYLKQRGLKIRARNLKLKTGEIDILAQDGPTLVIAEVKTKTSTQKGTPQEMVHFFKQRKLRTLARELSQRYPNQPIRIDVVAILQNPDGTFAIDHIENAVEGNG